MIAKHSALTVLGLGAGRDLVFDPANGVEDGEGVGGIISSGD